MKKLFFATFLVSVLTLSFGYAPVVMAVTEAGHGGGNTGGAGQGGSNTGGAGQGGDNSGGTTGRNLSIKINNPFDGPSTLPEIFKAIIDKILLPIGSIVVVIAFIFSGFQYVMARGNEEKISKAHSSLLYTAIGTVLILGAWVISTVIENTLNQLKG